MKLDPAFRILLLVCMVPVLLLGAYTYVTVPPTVYKAVQTLNSYDATLEMLDGSTYVYTHFEPLTDPQIKAINILNDVNISVIVNDYSIESLDNVYIP